MLLRLVYHPQLFYPAAMISKPQLRQTLRKRRQNLSAEQRLKFERAVYQHLLPLIKRGRKIGVYMAFGSELNLSDWIKTAQKRGTTVYIPFIHKNHKRLYFTQLQATQKMTKHHLGMLQVSSKRIRAERLHTILTPLIGIDPQGFRLGQGGGFYDATLSSFQAALRPKLIGVGFACQQCDHLPKDSWDMPLDTFVSEDGIRRFSRLKKE